jgi:hypothetical protein
VFQHTVALMCSLLLCSPFLMQLYSHSLCLLKLKSFATCFGLFGHPSLEY